MVIKIWVIEKSSPVSTTFTPSQWFIAGKTTVKKWVLIKTRRGTFYDRIWRGEIFMGGFSTGELSGHCCINVDASLVLRG